MGEPFEHEAEYGLVMPFVVCQPDGPYDAEAFVAGIYFGEASTAIKLACMGVTWGRYVPTGLVPQLDLLAMDASVPFKATPWVEHPDEWTHVLIGHGVREESPDD